MSEHTPGPWTVNDREDSLYVHGPFDGDSVAKGVLSYDAENGLEIYNDADKRLIFTAPELLEALEEDVRGWEAIKRIAVEARGAAGKLEDIRIAAEFQARAARAAIAKAMGNPMEIDGINHA